MRDKEGAGRPNGVGLHGLKVFVAEDEAFIALDLKDFLRDLGCVVLPSAPSVAEALAILEAERPDVALLDINLADGSAAPVAEALAIAGVPFAVMTGYAASQIGEAVLRAAPYLSKPYSLRDLYVMVAWLSALSQQPRRAPAVLRGATPLAKQLQPPWHPVRPTAGE